MISAQIKKIPFKGASQTVSLIFKSALESQESARQLAEDICRDLRSKDYLSEMLAINNYVMAHTRYMRDPVTIELVKSPNIIIQEINEGGIPQLDCDEMTALIVALCLAVGCKVRVVTVAFKNMFYNGERQFSHVFAQGYEPRSGTWITLDPVAGEKTKKMLKTIKAARIYNLN